MKISLKLALASMIGLAPALLPTSAFAQAWTSAAGGKDETVFVLTGDSIINRRLSTIDKPGVDKMFGVIRGADAAFTNLETVIQDFDLAPAEQSGGTYMGSPRFVLDELKWAGFDLLGLANNHTNDYGVDGMRSTLRALRKTDFIYAGVGENLAFARAPGYLDTKKGRVALISLSTTFPDEIAAGPQRKDMRGRPGLNPLHHTTTYTVPQETYDTLKQLRGPDSYNMGAEDDGVLKFGGARYVVGDEISMETTPDEADMRELVASIADAGQQADWVMVSAHSHDAKSPGEKDQPAGFYVQFAHAAIDAGADVVVTHGHHMLRGVEIYKGKPIFYSLGDFIFENDLVQFQPADNYEKVGLGPDALPSDYYTKRSKGDTVGFPADRRYWQSAVVEVVYNTADHALKAVRMHPVALGFGNKRSQRGQPYPAPEDQAEQIYGDLQEVSKPFGTHFELKRGLITVDLDH